MITFKQFISEAFSAPYPFKVFKRDDYHDYTFEVNGNVYEVCVAKRVITYKKYGPSRRYDIVFTFYDDEGRDRYNLIRKNDGSQFRILATVKDIIFKHFDSVHLDKYDFITFNTYEGATAELYTKFAKELAKRTQTTLEIQPESGSRKKFVLRK